MYAVASVLPPLLPTVFTISVGVSDNRLSKRNIACTNSEEILVAGKVKRAFFDKTGTLTKQGLEFLSAHSVDHWDEKNATVSQELTSGMAVCHSLTLSEGTGLLIGNPVDRAMFASSGAEFIRDKKIKVSSGETCKVLKHFDFDHHRMTQSVIVETADNKIVAFVKGSGERIQQLCLADTLPSDFNARLRASSKAGVYQISMAMKQLDLQAENLSLISRDDVEKDLKFIGVVDFKNILREETPAVIEELKGGQVRCVMVTGDSVLTGVCIAKESGIISTERSVLFGSQDDGSSPIWLDEDDSPVELPQELEGYDLAITGSLWESLDADTAGRLAEHILVFGRCTPVHKVSVVTYFVDRGWITLMCGDGGNDCGALKTAHVGIALSDTEASIVSPFTSLEKTITSVAEVLREGRCALASALASYKFMIMYGESVLNCMTTAMVLSRQNGSLSVFYRPAVLSIGHLIVFLNVISAYYHIMLAEWCWVFIDGVWTISLGFTLPLSGAADRLAPSRPTASLLGPHTMSSSLGVLFLHYLFTILSLITLQGLDWYQCRQWNGDDISNVLTIGDNYEAETLFLVVGFQFFASAMAFNFGYEFRGSWFRNTWLLVVLIIFITIQVVITLMPSKLSCLFRVNCSNEDVIRSVSTWEAFSIQNDWNTTEMPVSYRITLLVYMLLNTAVVMAYEYYVVNGIRRRRGERRREGKSLGFKVPPPEASDVSFEEVV
jgi:magnesium-transporting ATPase (P-type)